MPDIVPILMFVLLVQIAIATFIANDAKKRGRSSFTWFVLTLLFGILAMVIYAISITPYPEGIDSQTDSKVDNQVGPRHNFKCENCGWVYNKENRAERHSEQTGHTIADLRQE